MTQTTEDFHYPLALPERPQGWSKHLRAHLNFGGAGSTATYMIRDDQDRRVPIGYQYDTREGGISGFTLAGIIQPMTWSELHDIWPHWLADFQESRREHAPSRKHKDVQQMR